MDPWPLLISAFVEDYLHVGFDEQVSKMVNVEYNKSEWNKL